MRATSRMSVVGALTLALFTAPLGADAQELPAVEDLTNSDIAFETVASGLKDPTNMDVADDGRVFIAERTGRVKVWSPSGGVTELGRVGVDSKAGQCDDCAGRDLDEGGLHGLLLAKDFATSGEIYLYFSVPKSMGVATVPAKHVGARGPASGEGKFRLSRFRIQGDRIDLASEEPLFENPAEWAHCCHYGGDLEWMADGTMLLSSGDDTISSQSNGFAPRDERPGQEFNNAELTSQNLADRRGKLLRIDVDDVDGNGSDVPADNPFVGRPEADPYVYALGFRSPYRIAVDPKSQTVVVGNVGPDARNADANRGPAAHDELEIVPKGGGTNHGWPRCIGDNMPYNDYEWSTNVAGAPLSCAGLTPAAFSYTYQPSPTTNRNVRMGTGGSTAIGGVYYRPGSTGKLALPQRFHDRTLFGDWSRGGLWSLPVTEQGRLVNTLPTDLVQVRTGYATPIDMAVSPADGGLYVLEYGGALYNGSNGRLSRVVCSGCSTRSASMPVAARPVGLPAARYTSAGLALPLTGLGLLFVGAVRRRSRVA